MRGTARWTISGERRARAGVRPLLNGGLEKTQLPFLSAGQRNRVAFSKAGIAILARIAGGGVQHAIETQIGETICRNVLPNPFAPVAGGDQYFSRRCVDTVDR